MSNTIKDTSIRISISSKDKEALMAWCSDKGLLLNGNKATPSGVIRDNFILPLLKTDPKTNTF